MEILFVDKSPKIFNTYPLHAHGYWEIILSLYGTGISHVDGIEYEFKEGTIFCIPPNTLHYKSSEIGFMDMCLFLRDFDPIDSKKISIFEDDSNSTFKVLLKLAYDIQNKNEQNGSEIINSIGNTLYQLLVCWNSKQRKRNIPVEKFQNALLKNISNCNFDLSDEIKAIGYCDRYFRKIFKESTGYSPLNYLNHIRIEYSKKQLLQYHGIISIKEISLNSGFSDQYYFSRVFKQHEGISPLKFVQRMGTYDREKIFNDRQEISYY